MVAPTDQACGRINETIVLTSSIPKSGICVTAFASLGGKQIECNGTSNVDVVCSIEYNIQEPGNYTYRVTFQHPIRLTSSRTITIIATGNTYYSYFRLPQHK